MIFTIWSSACSKMFTRTLPQVLYVETRRLRYLSSTAVLLSCHSAVSTLNLDQSHQPAKHVYLHSAAPMSRSETYLPIPLHGGGKIKMVVLCNTLFLPSSLSRPLFPLYHSTRAVLRLHKVSSSRTFQSQKLSSSALESPPLASSPSTSRRSNTLCIFHTSPRLFTLSAQITPYRKDAVQACYQFCSLFCYRLCPVQ